MPARWCRSKGDRFAGRNRRHGEPASAAQRASSLFTLCLDLITSFLNIAHECGVNLAFIRDFDHSLLILFATDGEDRAGREGEECKMAQLFVPQSKERLAEAHGRTIMRLARADTIRKSTGTRLPKFAAGGSRNAREDWPNNVGSCAKGAGGLHRHEVDHICYWGASEKTTQVNHSGRSRLGLGDDFPCGRGRRDGPHAIISSALAVQILPLTGCPLAMRGPAHYRVAAGGRNVSGISANTNAITAMAAMLARISSGFTLSAVSAGE